MTAVTARCGQYYYYHQRLTDTPKPGGMTSRWTVLGVSLLLLVAAGGQEIGEMQQMLGSVFGSQLGTFRSSCCVIRDLQNPPRRRQYEANSQNSSNTLAAAMEQFSSCACSGGARCILVYPPLFLPDGADGVTYDVTFVTGRTTSQYACVYGTRSLTCRFRQSMRTGLLEWLLPSVLSGVSASAMQSSLAIFGEEMEEAVEQMMESGLPPAPLPSRQCRSCAPLQCAISLAREAERDAAMAARRVYPYGYHMQSSASGSTPRGPAHSTEQQRFHQCLRRNLIRPPELIPPTTTTTSKPWSSSPTRPTSTPQPSVLHNITTSLRPPQVTPAPITTSTPSTTSTTPLVRTTATPAPLSRTSPPTPPPPQTTVAATTTAVTTFTYTDQTTSLWSPWTISSPLMDDATTLITTDAPVLTSELPAVITRILVADTPAPTSTLATRKAVVLVSPGPDSDSRLGSAGLGGLVVGTVAALVALVTCFALVIVRRRRKKQQESSSNTQRSSDMNSSSPLHILPWKKSSQQHTPAHIHTVSSTQAVIYADEASLDEEEENDVTKKDDDDDDESTASCGNYATERYTPADFMKLSVKPSSSEPCRPSSSKTIARCVSAPKTSGAEQAEENVYASIDEATILPALSSEQRLSTDSVRYQNSVVYSRPRGAAARGNEGEPAYVNRLPPRYSEVVRSDGPSSLGQDADPASANRLDLLYDRPANAPGANHTYSSIKIKGGSGASEDRSRFSASDALYLHPCAKPSPPEKKTARNVSPIKAAAYVKAGPGPSPTAGAPTADPDGVETDRFKALNRLQRGPEVGPPAATRRGLVGGSPALDADKDGYLMPRPPRRY